MWCVFLCRPLCGFSVLVEIPSMAFWSPLVCLQSKFQLLYISSMLEWQEKGGTDLGEKVRLCNSAFGFLLTCIYLCSTLMFSDFPKPPNVPFCFQEFGFGQRKWFLILFENCVSFHKPNLMCQTSPLIMCAWRSTSLRGHSY